MAPNVLGSYTGYERACELVLNKKYAGTTEGAIEVREAVAKLRPLQLVMLMAELHLRPSQLHKPSTWDTTSYSWRESEGTARWINVRNDVFHYPPAVFEREAMDHFTTQAATSADTTTDDEDGPDDDQA